MNDLAKTEIEKSHKLAEQKKYNQKQIIQT